MLVAIVPLLFAVASALVFALTANAKLSRIAEITFLASMLALMLALASHTIRVG